MALEIRSRAEHMICKIVSQSNAFKDTCESSL